MRTIDTEHNWFWKEGYTDGLTGRRCIVPDETRHPFQRSDYFAGYEAGNEDRAASAEAHGEQS
jgi:ribosome modulation factor